MSERIGAAAWGFRELSLEEQLKLCKKLGFSCLELGIANAPRDVPVDAAEEQLKEIVKLYQSYGIELTCAATGNDFTLLDAEEIKEQVEKVKKAIDICKTAGILYLRIFAGFSPVYEVIGERWEYMIQALNEAAAYAESQGVVLAIETHGGVNGFEDGVEHFASVSTETETLEKMLRELKESVMFVFDPANLAAAGHEELVAQYNLLKERIAYMHVKNFKLLPSGHLDPAAAENGILDWEKFLSESGFYTGAYLVEYEKTDTIEQGSRESMESLKKWGISK